MNGEVVERDLAPAPGKGYAWNEDGEWTGIGKSHDPCDNFPGKGESYNNPSEGESPPRPAVKLLIVFTELSQRPSV